jgi:WD40 repeat protein
MASIVTGGPQNRRDGEVKVWEFPSAKLLFTLRGHAGHISSAAFSPDARRMATSSLDGTIKLWDIANRQEVLTLAHSASRVTFSADGTRLIAVSGNTVYIFDGRPVK